MKLPIVYDYPPNYQVIKQTFKLGARPVVFTYDGKLYVPKGGDIPDHLMAHESTHAYQQQIMGADVWWTIYLDNPEFRLSQELEAYQVQYRMFKSRDRAFRRKVLRQLASDLASPIYGSIINFEDAKEAINI